MPSIRVDLPHAAHDIVIERGGLDRVGAMLREVAPAHRTVLAVDRCHDVASVHGPRVEASLLAAGFQVGRAVALAADERMKTLASASAVHSAMLEAGLDRHSPLVVVGGGLLCDVASFGASTYKRGAPHLLVPTTLLAMVDAAIGGKTGVNLGSRHGELIKNVVGTFWQPRRIVVDTTVLETLPLRELRCGLAECVKHALVGDPGLLEWLDVHVDRVLALDAAALEALLVRSIAVKVRIVVADETEQGERAHLNLGHTFGHAIEPIETLGLKHGEAVAIGLCAAMRVAVRRGTLEPTDAQRVEALLRRIGLPTVVPSPTPSATGEPVDLSRLLRAMGHDKKNVDGRLRLVLPRGVGRAELVDDVDPDEVAAAWAHVGIA